jgi:NAD-dependent dihydropyrimidine dehydrogenase PreA subunit/nitroreductase
MSIPTTRTSENAHVSIDLNSCNFCGACVEVCKDFALYIEGEKLLFKDDSLFGCFGCGQCAAVCPNGSITVEGRTLSAEDFIKQPSRGERTTYDYLYKLMLSRRSIRDYKEKDVEQAVIDEILEAASTSPMGIPPSDVGVFVLKGKDKLRQFSFDFIDGLKPMKKFFSPFMLAVMKPFIKKNDYELTKKFIIPLIDFFTKSKAEEKNFLLYDAPLAMYFYNSGYADPVDPVIPAAYAMLAAQSLGLGSCMIGSIAPFLKYMKSFKKKYGLPESSKDGVFLIIGYPKYKYAKAIKRTFAKVDYY